MSATAPPDPPPDPPSDAKGELRALTEASRRAFSETADPAAYVERAASAATLREIEAWLDEAEGATSVGALVATPGLGKTMLLRVVEARLNRRSLAADTPAARPDALYLPYAGLAPTDLALWVYGLLGRARPRIESEREAVEALLALGDPKGAPFTLLLDDADSMPPETIAALTAGLAPESGSLRWLVAVNPDSKGSRLRAALHALAPREFAYRERLDLAETGAYLRTRMRWAGFPDALLERVDEDEIQRIFALSNGLPRAIHAIAADRFDAMAAVGGTEALGEKRRREDWMGRPIDFDLEG
ncbi:MAG: AAA family ATPase [Myxococcota bacterium]